MQGSGKQQYECCCSMPYRVGPESRVLEILNTGVKRKTRRVRKMKNADGIRCTSHLAVAATSTTTTAFGKILKAPGHADRCCPDVSDGNSTPRLSSLLRSDRSCQGHCHSKRAFCSFLPFLVVAVFWSAAAKETCVQLLLQQQYSTTAASAEAKPFLSSPECEKADVSPCVPCYLPVVPVLQRGGGSEATTPAWSCVSTRVAPRPLAAEGGSFVDGTERGAGARRQAAARCSVHLAFHISLLAVACPPPIVPC